MQTLVDLPNDLQIARRSLDACAHICDLGDWQWDDSYFRWRMEIRISLIGLTLLPEMTDWFFLVDHSYPYGAIDVVPSNSQNGLSSTFAHQRYNDFVEDRPFRSGTICLSDPFGRLGRGVAKIEPFSADERLLWHMDRLCVWIRDADSGNLLKPGDHFELPHFPSTQDAIFGFNETGTTYNFWKSSEVDFGYADLAIINNHAAVVTQFREFGSRGSLVVDWGTQIDNSQKSQGIWLRMKELPVVENWRVPITWKELIALCKKQNINLLEILQSLAGGLRDGYNHLLLIGFPIPDFVGSEKRVYHWQAINLPILSWGSQNARGFRRNDSGYWYNDLSTIFLTDRKLEWLQSFNWSLASLQARGTLLTELASKSIALIGCGSLGSKCAELLVRLGVYEITLIDGDKLYAPNLSRHNLSIFEIGMNKAVALRDKLNSSNPFARVKAVDANLNHFGNALDSLHASDIIVDCSASDAVLHILGRAEFASKKEFYSFSFSQNCEKLYAFKSRGVSFEVEQFHYLSQPTIKEDLNAYGDTDLVWESFGCWHPLFPGRIDDISVLAAHAVKWIEAKFFESEPFFEAIPLSLKLSLLETGK
jgi:ThiF family